MIQYIATNFQRKLTTDEIASHANLHPDYATLLLRRSIGTTMIDLITCYRVIHSQRLLITTATTISEIARQSGFDTLSRYNAAFKQFSSTTPSAYRREMGTFQGEGV
jgi:AraC-like DNA-binding protein